MLMISCLQHLALLWLTNLPLILVNLFLARNYELSIFNRYGQQVFFSRNPTERWDGGIKSTRSGPETYTWMARYLFRNRQMLRKGTVMLIK